ELERWIRSCDSFGLCDAVVNVAAGTAHARSRLEAWRGAEEEKVADAGWALFSRVAMEGGEGAGGAYEGASRASEEGIHGAKNMVRYAMNGALIAIGTRSDALAKKAIAAAKRIGKVEVDHGDTSCKTPDAVAYIPKAREYAAKRQAKAAGKARP